jgi:hypothetical protein
MIKQSHLVFSTGFLIFSSIILQTLFIQTINAQGMIPIKTANTPLMTQQSTNREIAENLNAEQIPEHLHTLEEQSQQLRKRMGDHFEHVNASKIIGIPKMQKVVAGGFVSFYFEFT